MSSKLPVAAIGAWLLVAVYYFFQYALRSAPSVMMPQLTDAFGVNALGVSAIVRMFYYGYSPFSLVAGTSMDRFGAKRVILIGAAVVGIGAILFGTGNVTAANVGRFLQGAGGAFALIGAVYLITKNFPASGWRVAYWRDTMLLAIVTWVMFGNPAILRGHNGRDPDGNRFGCGHATVHCHRGSESAGVGRHSDGSHQLS